MKQILAVLVLLAVGVAAQTTRPAESPEKSETTVTGVLVDEADRPLAGARIDIDTNACEPGEDPWFGISKGPSSTCDDEGRFSFRYDPQHWRREGETDTALRFMIFDQAALLVRVGDRRFSETGEKTRDLGRVRCAELPLLVAGRIVDDQGKGLAGLEVQLLREKEVWEPIRPGGYGRGPNVIRTDPDITETWTDSEGRFRVMARCFEPRNMLSIQPEGHDWCSREFRTGEKDVRVVSHRLVSVNGRLEGMKDGANEYLLAVAVDLETGQEWSAPCLGERSWNLRCPPGRYRLLGRWRNQVGREPVAWGPIFSVTGDEGLEVKAPLVLGGSWIDLHFLKRSDQAPWTSRFEIVDPETGYVFQRLRSWRLETEKFHVPKLPILLRASFAGCRPWARLVTDASAAVPVDLQPGPELALDLSGLPDGIHAIKNMSLYLLDVATEKPGLNDVRGWCPLNGNGTCRMTVPGPGRYRLVVGRTPTSRHGWFGTFPGRLIEVADLIDFPEGKERVEFSLALDLPELR